MSWRGDGVIAYSGYDENNQGGSGHIINKEQSFDKLFVNLSGVEGNISCNSSGTGGGTEEDDTEQKGESTYYDPSAVSHNGAAFPVHSSQTDLKS